MKKLLPYALAFLLFAALPASQPGGSRAQTRKPKSRALLVGISTYEGPNVPSTRGAEEDATETAEFIKSQYGFLDSEIKMLRGKEATAKNIVAEFQHWLIEGTQPGDRVFFLYAGHGSQLPDDGNDEDDGLDETLAPYDVKPDGTNMIRDDEIGRLTAQLSGRLAVLLFDSCHSGTISRAPVGGSSAAKSDARYLPSPKQVTAARAVGTRGGGSGEYEVRDLPQDDSRILKTRDLKLVKTKTVGPAAGIVVISAARAGQVAFSMDVGGGRQRGALSYVFCQAHRNRTPTLKELGDEIEIRFNELHRDKRLKGTQQPDFEVISTVPLNDKPLFADELTVPAVAFANPSSALKVTLRSLEKKQTYKLGEDISYEVTTSAPGWLYLLVFSQNPVATCVFPTKDDPDNYVKKDAIRLPRSDYFQAQAPTGKDVVIALLSSVKLDLGDKEEMTWDEVFDRLRSKKLAGYVKTRGVGTKKPGQSSGAPSPASLDEADWQAASLVIETVSKPIGQSAQPARKINLKRK
ncbi:MAG: caspase family protein [Acidobacteriota bacterium]